MSFYQQPHNPLSGNFVIPLQDPPRSSAQSGSFFWPSIDPIIYYPQSAGPGQAVQSSPVRPQASNEYASASQKHRRSRTGCTTCRSRRVKCDEARPICNRCRKGCRTCVYPDQTNDSAGTPVASGGSKSPRSSPPKSEKRRSKRFSIGSSLSTDWVAEGSPVTLVSNYPTRAQNTDLSSPLMDFAATTSPASPQVSEQANPSEGPKSFTAITPTLSLQSPELTQKLEKIDAKAAFYLKYQISRLTNLHYGLDTENDEFLHVFLIQEALGFQPLLNAVAAFSAYHCAVAEQTADLRDFLVFYGSSLRLLRIALSTSIISTVPVLLAMLQLALIEENLSDWVNLKNHQTAAFQILTSIFTPESVASDHISATIVDWYLRLDTATAYLANKSAIIAKEWFYAAYYNRLIRKQNNPTQLECLYEERFAYLRLFAADLAMLSARRAYDDDLTELFTTINDSLREWYTACDTALFDSSDLLTPKPSNNTDLPSSPTTEHNTDTIPRFGGQLLTSNFLLLHFHCLQLIFLATQILNDGTADDERADLRRHALNILKTVEAIAQHDTRPGALTAIRIPLALACLCLQHESQYIPWCREKLAAIEGQGYIFPLAYTERLRKAWKLEPSGSWSTVGDDGKGIIGLLKDLVEDRYRETEKTVDTTSPNLRNSDSLFASFVPGNVDVAA